MSDSALALVPDEMPDGAAEREPVDRDQDLLGRRPRGGESPKTGIRARLDKLFDAINKGFDEQAERADGIQDYWDCYNCKSNENKYYNGIADIYFPIIHDAVEAIVTRYVNQLFPQGGRYVQAVAADGNTEGSLVALLDHYIRQGSIKTQVAEPLVRNGQVEGQYNLYMDWAEIERQIVSRETHGPIDPQTGQEMPGEEIEDITEETIIEGFPVFEVLHDTDVLILPPTADSVQEALSAGGSVTIVRRWSKEKIKAMAREGNIREDAAEALEEEMGKVSDRQGPDIEKHILEQVGIRKHGREAVCWETWVMLPLDEKGKFSDDGRMRLCRVFFGPMRAQLGAKRNPYWNDRCPLISRPVKKMAGAAKGPSPISYVESLQYEANDAVNEGADAATLSAAPIVARDPEKVDGPLVYNVGAVWDAPPGSVELLTFPDLTPRAATRVQMALQAIFQNLNVNPSMLPQQTRASKPNQAMIAQEQAVDLLTTAMGVSTLEDVLTEAVGWVVDLDYQFRDRDLMVRAYGEVGQKAAMEQVAPLQNRNGFTFIWRGGEQVRQNAAIAQGGVQAINMMMQPAMQQVLAAEGKRFTPAKIIERMIDNQFGPDLGGTAITDIRSTVTNPPERENDWMSAGLAAHVHPMDDDNAHLQSHFEDYQASGDPHGLKMPHMQAHQAQAQQKIQAQMMMQMQQQQQGAGGGRPPGLQPPQSGAMPAGPRLIKGPPGTMHPDQMMRAGGIQMPRKT